MDETNEEEELNSILQEMEDSEKLLETSPYVESPDQVDATHLLCWIAPDRICNNTCVAYQGRRTFPEGPGDCFLLDGLGAIGPQLVKLRVQMKQVADDRVLNATQVMS